MAEGCRGRLNVGAELVPELVERLDRIAAEQGVSRSDVIRDLLRRGAEVYEHERGLLRQLRAVGGR